MQEHCVSCYKVTRCYSYKSSLWDIEKAADKPCCLYPSLGDWITEVSQTSCHAWKMEVQVAQTGSCGKDDKLDPPHWKMTAGMTQVRTAYLFLREWLSLPFIFAMHGGVPWTMTVRQPFCTLKDCSSCFEGCQAWCRFSTWQKPHQLRGSWWESGGKMYYSLLWPKKQVTKESDCTKLWTFLEDHAPSRTSGIIRGEQEAVCWTSWGTVNCFPCIVNLTKH